VVADQQAALFGNCCFREGDMKITLGTGCFVGVNTGTKPRLVTPTDLYPVVAWSLGRERTYMTEGNAPACGSLVEWARRIGLFQHVDELAPILAKAQLDTQNSSDAPFFVPGLSGLGAPFRDPNATGAFIGISYNTTREQLITAVLESIAFRCVRLSMSAADDRRC
jgi:putative glycerol kinase 5